MCYGETRCYNIRIISIEMRWTNDAHAPTAVFYSFRRIYYHLFIKIISVVHSVREN